jgi:ABC-type transport system substrate-binding protein
MNQVLQFQITSNLLSGLMHIDSQLIARGDIAESWTISSDGREYVFKLREGVTFHNGDKFTANDVVYTYNRSKDPDKSFHYRVLNNVKDVAALNDLEVKITLGKPQASFLGKTLERSAGRAMTIVNRRAIEEMGDTQYGLTPVGTGPFRITFHELGQGVVLEKFDDYYDPERPKLDKVTIKPIVDTEPLAAAIEAGDIQLAGGGGGIAPELVERFQANSDLVVDMTPGPGFQALWINPWSGPFKVTNFNGERADERERIQGAPGHSEGPGPRAAHQEGALRPRCPGLWQYQSGHGFLLR